MRRGRPYPHLTFLFSLSLSSPNISLLKFTISLSWTLKFCKWFECNVFTSEKYKFWGGQLGN
jgi:hypothetical protein